MGREGENHKPQVLRRESSTLVNTVARESCKEWSVEELCARAQRVGEEGKERR